MQNFSKLTSHGSVWSGQGGVCSRSRQRHFDTSLWQVATMRPTSVCCICFSTGQLKLLPTHTRGLSQELRTKGRDTPLPPSLQSAALKCAWGYAVKMANMTYTHLCTSCLICATASASAFAFACTCHSCSSRRRGQNIFKREKLFEFEMAFMV